MSTPQKTSEKMHFDLIIIGRGIAAVAKVGCV